MMGHRLQLDDCESNISYHDCVCTIDSSLPNETNMEKRVVHCQEAFSKSGLSKLRLAHVKGFANNMVINENYKTIENELISQIREGKYEVIAWDGDDYKDNCFTRTLCTIHDKLPYIKFCAFLRNCDRTQRDDGLTHGFDKCWKGRFKINCFLVDDACTYEHLGNLAIQVTNSKIAYCLGGGECVLNEKETAQRMGLGVEFIPFDATREKDGIVEHSPLLSESV